MSLTILVSMVLCFALTISVAVSIGLSAVAGSSVATTFAIGAILIPALIKHGYPVTCAAALQATSAELGVIIAPSIPMILYGVSAEVSIGEMFIAGIGPGAADAGDHSGCHLRRGVHAHRGRRGGGFYALIVGVVIYREIGVKDLFNNLRKSAISSAVVLFIIANAGMFAYLITRAGVPDAIGRFLVDALQSPFYFLLGVYAALFLIGMFIETSAAIIVLAPILAPVAQHFGIDPIHFGLVMVVNLALGMVTPPFGVNLFAASTVAKISVDRIVRDLVPFVLVVLACLMVISYVPVLSLGLRDLIYAR